LKAKDIIAIPKYDNPKGPVKDAISHLDYKQYYNDANIKLLVDAIITKMVDGIKEPDGT
jgi:hypothetical protein